MSFSAIKNSIGHNIRTSSYNNWTILQKVSDLKAENHSISSSTRVVLTLKAALLNPFSDSSSQRL